MDVPIFATDLRSAPKDAQLLQVLKVLVILAPGVFLEWSDVVVMCFFACVTFLGLYRRLKIHKLHPHLLRSFGGRGYAFEGFGN